MTMIGTPVDGLQYTDGNDAIATGDDMIKAALLLIDGRLHTPGDLKHSVQTADHGLWVVADGRNSIVRANVNAAYNTLADANGWSGSDGSHVGTPDYRGRTLVGLGTGPDVNTINKNDSLAVANRSPKHNHSRGTLLVANRASGISIDSVAGHSHGGATGLTDLQHLYNSPGSGLFLPASGDTSFGVWVTTGSGHNHSISDGGSHAHTVSDPGHIHTLTGTIGATTGPSETPAYGVGTIFVFVGKP